MPRAGGELTRRPARSALGNNRFVGSIPDSLSSLARLEELCVRDVTRQRGWLCVSEVSCASVRSIEYNQLSGTLPASLGSLTQLEALCVRVRAACPRLRS